MTFLTIVIDLNPNLFRIGPFLITWHGVFAVLGILAAARLGLWLLEKDGVDTSHGADGVAWMVVLGLAGARALYVWENFRIFAGGNLLRVFALTEGGISQWGGLFGAMAGAYVWARRARIPYWKLIDAGGAAAMIGLAVGRIGDVINGEHHGTPTNVPWGVEYVNPATLGDPGAVVHPEVAYEMVLTLALLGALLPFHQRLKTRLPEWCAWPRLPRGLRLRPLLPELLPHRSRRLRRVAPGSARVTSDGRDRAGRHPFALSASSRGGSSQRGGPGAQRACGRGAGSGRARDFRSRCASAGDSGSCFRYTCTSSCRAAADPTSAIHDLNDEVV